MRRIASVLLLALAPLAAAAEPAAFPGAVGYGRGATGWRGGAVITVTTLADQGPGSLRACVQRTGPRVCLFGISGTIVLDSPLWLGSDLYVAGQTAPGEGIQIRLGASRITPVIVKDANDVVIRFLKIRPGAPVEPGPSVDAVTLENARRVYLDRLSLMYATDETFNIHVSGGEASDITLARSILAWGLDKANHPKGRHSKGALICSGEGTPVDCGRITLWRNLFAHNRDRNPDVKATGIGPVDVLNNVFYDPISLFGEFYNHYSGARISYAGNLALTGPSTMRPRPEAVQAFALFPGHTLAIYAAGNLALDRGRCSRRVPFAVLNREAETRLLPEPPAPFSAPLVPAAELLETVLAGAGDRTPQRGPDALDRQLAAEVAECRGRVVNAASEAGGWPDLPERRGPPDSDGDGLPDGWEAGRAGLDPAAASDVWAADPVSGLSYIEAWLAELAGDGEAQP